MPTEGGDTASHEAALQRAVDEALAGLPGGDRAVAPEAVDARSLAIGLRLSLEHPDQARQLLQTIGNTETEGAPPEGAAEAEPRPALVPPRMPKPRGGSPSPRRSSPGPRRCRRRSGWPWGRT